MKAELNRKSWLYRSLAFETSEGKRHRVEYDGKSFNPLGCECIRVDSEVVTKRSGQFWFVPSFSFSIGSLPAILEVRVWPWLCIRGLRLTLGQNVVYSEGRVDTLLPVGSDQPFALEFLRWSVDAFIIAATLNGLSLLAQCVAMMHGTRGFLLTLPESSGYLLFVVVLAIPGTLCCALFKDGRRISILLCLSELIYVFVAITCIGIGDNVRMHGIHRLAERSVPLIAAINQYAQEHGRPPQALEGLVPEFLPAVPTTGMGAHPRYDYEAGPRTKQVYHGNPWVLWVNTPSGLIGFERMLYLPKQNYEEIFRPGSKRIGGWAYVYGD